MIEANHLTKRYGKTVAVNEVSFTVKPGQVTGFLGPNGAGKSTTMRMILGLDTPSSGSVLVNGKPYRELTDPLRSVGALLDAGAIVGGRSAAGHLAWLAALRPPMMAFASSSAPTDRSGSVSSRYGLPLTRTEPELGVSRPRIMRMVVDLPAPFGPRNPVTRPGRTAKEASSTATVLP